MPLELRIKIIDMKTGKVEVDRPSHSFVIAFIQTLCCYWKGGQAQGTNFQELIVDTGGVGRTGSSISSASSGFFMNLNGAVAVYDNDGIQVGTSNVAQDPTDRALINKINTGTGGGQLEYGPSGFVLPVNVAGTISTIVSRTVRNASPGPITINEVGIYAQVQMGAVLFTICIVRDVVDPVLCNVGDVKLCQYILQTVN